MHLALEFPRGEVVDPIVTNPDISTWVMAPTLRGERLGHPMRRMTAVASKRRWIGPLSV